MCPNTEQLHVSNPTRIVTDGNSAELTVTAMVLSNVIFNRICPNCPAPSVEGQWCYIYIKIASVKPLLLLFFKGREESLPN